MRDNEGGQALKRGGIYWRVPPRGKRAVSYGTHGSDVGRLPRKQQGSTAAVEASSHLPPDCAGTDIPARTHASDPPSRPDGKECAGEGRWQHCEDQ